MTPDETLARNYRAALVGAVSRRCEATLNRGYELGRDALAEGISVLELARTHHECLVELLRGTPPAEVPEVAVAASEFFLETLAALDMAQRAYLEGRRAQQADPVGRSVSAPGRAAGGR